MPASRGQKPKRNILPPTEEVEIVLTRSTWVALTPDHPQLRGRTYTGKSLDDALISARGDVARHFKGIAIPILKLQD